MLSALILSTVVLAANPYLDEGRSLYQSLQHERALSTLQLAAEVPGQTQQERRESFDLLARCHAALGNLAAARAAYAKLLEVDATAPAPQDAAPKIREAFRQAKLSLYPEGTVRITRRPAAEGELSLELLDPWAAVDAIAVHEQSGVTRLPPAPKLQLRLGEATAAFWVEALGADGAVLSRMGSAEQPLAVHRASAPPTRKTKGSAAAMKSPTAVAPTSSSPPGSARGSSLTGQDGRSVPQADAAAALKTDSPRASSLLPANAVGTVELQQRPQWRNPVAAASISVSAAALAAGVVLGVLAEEKRRAVSVLDPASSSQPEAFALARSQRDFAMAANASYATAGAAALAGILVWILGPSPEVPQP